MSDLPWGKFFWDKWRNDHALQSCDMAAQGLWINLLCIMHRSERIGYLMLNGKAMSVADIAKFVGIRKDRAERLITKLKAQGVCSVDENGAIYSRRIVREQAVFASQTVDKYVDKSVGNNQGKLKFDENRTKTERKSYENRNHNQGKSTVTAVSLIKNKDKEFKKEKRKKVKLTDDLNQTFFAFMKTACERLQDVAKIDAVTALSLVETWLEEARHDGEIVLKAIETGWGKEYPIAYISKVIASKVNPIKVKTAWKFEGQAYDEDPRFQALARNDQGVILSFLRSSNPQPWLMKHIKNHNTQAFNFLHDKGLIAQEFAQ